MSFDEIQFPKSLSENVRMFIGDLTDVTEVRAGAEFRDPVRTKPRNRFRVGVPARNMDAVHDVLTFLYARSGRTYGFRLWVPFDYKSSAPLATAAFGDQAIGTADGVTTAFQLVKTYPSGPRSRVVTIRKPVAGSVLVGVGGVEQVGGWTVDTTTGIVTFAAAPGPTLWTPSTAKAQNDKISPTVANGRQFFVQNGGGGTTGATEPTWNLTIGGTTADNDITWETEAAQTITAGYEFDYPVRLVNDENELEALGPDGGRVPDLEMIAL